MKFKVKNWNHLTNFNKQYRWYDTLSIFKVNLKKQIINSMKFYINLRFIIFSFDLKTER